MSVSPPAADAEPAPPPVKKRRGFETVRDMVLSMSLVGAVVFGVFWMVAWQRPEVQGPVRPAIDVEQVFRDVQISDPFLVLAPTGLADGWTPTSAWFEPAGVNVAINGGVLHVGYLTPAGSYAEVRQTNGDRAVALAEWVDDATVIDTVSLESQPWDVVQSDSTGKQGIVLEQDGTVVVVTGKAEMDELQELATALR